MDNCRTIMVTSCKGGVGKSTIAANLGIKLALSGKKVVIIDCDFGVRSLDLIMGLEDEIIFDIVDIVKRNISPEKALVRDERAADLYFCAAPYSYSGELDEESFAEGVNKIRDYILPDYIIVDTPGDTGAPFRLAAAVSDMALVVSTYQPISIRAAESTGILLEKLAVKDRRLIINCFDPFSGELSELPGITEIIDKTAIRLIGIIPFDTRLREYQSRGEDVFHIKDCDAAVAFINIEKRLDGLNVPLFTGFRNHKRADLLRSLK